MAMPGIRTCIYFSKYSKEMANIDSTESKER